MLTGTAAKVPTGFNVVVAKRTKKKQKAAAVQPTPAELAELGLMVANVKSASG